MVSIWVGDHVNVPWRLEGRAIRSGGFRVGVARGKTKNGDPLMTSSYSANRDYHFDLPKIRPPKDMFLRLRHN